MNLSAGQGRCVVLGGNGFLGLHLVDLLRQRGTDVTVFDRVHSSYRQPLAGVRYVLGDWNDWTTLTRVLQGAEVVFHLISTTAPKSSNEDPSFDVASNVLNTLALLEACVVHKVRRVVFSSSGGTVYGTPQKVPISETHPTNPICSYGITKLTIEKYLALFHRLHGLDYVILRPSNAYGEYQNLGRGQGAIGMFLQQVAHNEPITIWGDGSIVRDYVYAADIARAFLLAAETDTQEREFNIGSGIEMSLGQLLELIFEVTGRRVPVQHMDARAFDVPCNVLDTSRARKALGWSPVVSLPDGLQRTWRWIQEIKSTPSFIAASQLRYRMINKPVEVMNL